MERPGSHSVLHNIDEERQTYWFFFDGRPAVLAKFKKSNEGKHFMAAKTDKELRYWLSKFFMSQPQDTAKQKKGGKS